MSTLLFILIILGIGYALYNAGFRSGKQIGSRKAYRVGFDRGRKQRTANNTSGCLLMFLTLGLLATTGTIALAHFL